MCIGVAAAALIAMLAGIQVSFAATFTVSCVSAFNGHTSGQVTTGFDSVTGLDFPSPFCPGAQACFAGFTPLTVNGITFSTAPGEPVNVNTAHYYGAGDLGHQYVVNAN